MATHGLTLGKFAPLHRGHQLVIETALAEVDRVSVLVYDSPYATPVPLPVRCEWVRRLYPGVRVIEGWGGPPDTGTDARTMRVQESFVARMLGGERVTHFYSSEFYGEHMSAALGAVDRRVDPARSIAPISATEIRRDPFTARDWMHPMVYGDHVARVVLLGAPSTGKTTLAHALAERFETVWVPEYGREYWDAHQVNRRLTSEQLVEIAEGHRRQEDARCAEARRFLFVDTNALTTYLFALHYHGAALPRLVELANACTTRYDFAFLCEDDIPYDDTPDRSGPEDRARAQRRTVDELLLRRIPFARLRGSLKQRLDHAAALLRGVEKWGNPWGALAVGGPSA